MNFRKDLNEIQTLSVVQWVFPSNHKPDGVESTFSVWILPFDQVDHQTYHLQKRYNYLWLAAGSS